MGPEVQAKDVAFPREQVVADVQSRHRFEMAADDAIGDQLGDGRGLIAAVLDVVQRRRADAQSILVGCVPLGHPCVEVPAVVVEACGVGDGANAGEILSFELAEADGDVRDLDAGVVDVVLDLDDAAQIAEQPAEGVSERGVAQVADVRGLVRVDGGVLDDGLFGGGRRRRSVAVHPGVEMVDPIEEEIDVAVRRLNACEPVQASEPPDDLLRDDFRRLAQPSSQLERERHRQIAERAARRNVDDNGGKRRVIGSDAVESGHGLGNSGTDDTLDGKNHAGLAAVSGIFRNIHDTIPQRFRLHATESLGPLIIMRRVDVHKEQAVRIAGRHEFRPDFLDPQFLDGKRGFQRSCVDPAAQDVGASCRPRRAERLVAARDSAESRPRPPTAPRAARAGATKGTADRSRQPACACAAMPAAPCRCRQAARRPQSRREPPRLPSPRSLRSGSTR